LKGIVGKANMTTGQAGRYFGWGRGSSLTKNASNFTKEQLVKDGFTREILEEMAEAYEGIAKTLSKNDLANHAAPARAKQIRDILENLF